MDTEINAPTSCVREHKMSSFRDHTSCSSIYVVLLPYSGALPRLFYFLVPNSYSSFLLSSQPSPINHQSLSFFFVASLVRHDMIFFRLVLRPIVVFIAYLCASASCTPTNSNSGPHTAEDLSTLLRRQDVIFSILGISGLGVSTIQPRLEIRDLERNNPDQWNVFLLGLQRFQSVSQNDKLSYFQIAGKSTSRRPFVVVSISPSNFRPFSSSNLTCDIHTCCTMRCSKLRRGFSSRSSLSYDSNRFC